MALKASWVGLKEEKWVRKGWRGKGGVASEEGAEVEGAIVKGEGSWVDLEKDDEQEKGMKRNRSGNEGSPVRKGWRWREPPWRGRAHEWV